MPNELMTRKMTYLLPDGEEMNITPQMVQKYLVTGRKEFITEQELLYFMHECKARRMNPFLRECWLIKYSQKDNAQIVESIHHKRNKARRHPDCLGWRKGIVYQDSEKKIRESTHPFLPEGCVLMGGFFEATPKGWLTPFRHEVSLASVVKRKQDGSLTVFWKVDKQPQQVMKVAESQGLSALWGDTVGAGAIPEEVPDIEPRHVPASPVKVQTTENAPMQRPAFDGDRRTSGPSETQKQTESGETLPGPIMSVQGQGNSAISGGGPEDPFLGDVDGDLLVSNGEPGMRSRPSDEAGYRQTTWWENDKHILYRKQIPMYLLVLLGRGQTLFSHNVPMPNGSLLYIGEEQSDLMASLAKDNPMCVNTLDHASSGAKKNVIHRLSRKLGIGVDLATKLVCGDIGEWLENFRIEAPQETSLQEKEQPPTVIHPEREPGSDDDDPFPTPVVKDPTAADPIAAPRISVPEPRTDLTGEPYLLMMKLYNEYPHDIISAAFEEMQIHTWPTLLQHFHLLKDICDQNMKK